MAAVRSALLETADRIRALGKEVVFVSPTPATGDDIGQCLAAAELAGGPQTSCDFPLTDSGITNAKGVGFLYDLSDRIAVIDLTALICPGGLCFTRTPDVFLFRDPGHLSVEGAEWLGRTYRFDRLIRQSATLQQAPINLRRPRCGRKARHSRSAA